MKNRKIIIGVIVLASILLYLAGVFSGLQASKVIEIKTEADIESLKQETREDIEFLAQDTEKQVAFLREYIDFLETSLRSLQLEQTFSETLDEQEQCRFSEITMDYLFDELTHYWGILPYRIEQYERDNTLTPEYKSLKSQYTQLSIRTWMLAKNMHDKCDDKIVYGLHFYATECRDCVRQGEELDEFSDVLKDEGYDVVLFPIDINSEESIVQVLRQYYGVRMTPAVLINEQLMQGRLLESSELLETIR